MFLRVLAVDRRTIVVLEDPAMSRTLKIIGIELRRARLGRSMTQQDLGRAIGIAIPTVCNYEAGRVDMPATALFKAARALRLSLDEVVRLAARHSGARKAA